MRPKSVTQFLDGFLSERGYERKGKGDWYKFFDGALVVVNLQKSAFGPGVYLNFGLSFLKGKRRRYPKEYDCDVFGRNPASFPTRKKVRFQSLLDDVGLLLQDSRRLPKLQEGLGFQLGTIEAWSEKTLLRKRLKHEETLDMLVNKRAWKRLIIANQDTERESERKVLRSSTSR